MAQNKLRLPSSEGGLVRYFDEEHKVKIQLKPEYVIALCVITIIVGLALSAYGGRLLGL